MGKQWRILENAFTSNLVRPDETDKIRKLTSSLLYSRHEVFANDLMEIDMYKSNIRLDKPVYTGMTILANSRILLYEFYYNELKKITAQSDSLCTQTQTVFCLK